VFRVLVLIVLGKVAFRNRNSGNVRRQTDMLSGAFVICDLHRTLFLRLMTSRRMKWVHAQKEK